MKRQALIFVLCLVSQCFGSVALVQSTIGGSVSASASTSQTFTTSAAGFGSNTVSGNLLILVIWVNVQCSANAVNSGGHPPSTPGFTWVPAQAEDWGGTGTTLTHKYGLAGIYYIANAASMATSVLTTVQTVQTAISAYTVQAEFALFEFSGVATSTPLERSAIARDITSPSIPSRTTIIANNNGDLIIAAFSADRDNGTNGAAGAGYTLGPNAAVATVGQDQYMLSATTGANATAFGSTQQNWAYVGAVFQVGTAPPSPLSRHKGYVF